jgi:hypothetical protein
MEAAMADIDIAQFTGCRGNPTDGTITIVGNDPKGEAVNVRLPAQQALALIPAVHRATKLVVEQQSSGPPKQGQVQVFQPQTVAIGMGGHDPIVMFDQGLPSEVNFQLSEDLAWRLADQVSTMLKLLQGKKGQH